MNEVFLWIEETPLSIWVRESTSIVAFPGILSAHAIGMALAAGISAVFALHILGVAAKVPSGEFRRFVPVMWFGFWLNTASGVLLLIAYPTKALTNPVFYVKLLFIASAVSLFVFMRNHGFSHEPTAADERLLEEPATPRTLKLAAAASLVCWAGSITAGRLLAYTYGRLLASW